MPSVMVLGAICQAMKTEPKTLKNLALWRWSAVLAWGWTAAVWWRFKSGCTSWTYWPPCPSTPLMRLLLRIDLSDAIDDAERSALGADIHELDRRIDRFIEHARTGAEEPVVALDLAALLRAEIESSRARGRHWQVDAVDVAIVRGQPGVLARLIANLIDNAEQHGAAPWRVELARADDREPQWRLRVDNAIAPANKGQAVATAPHRGFGLALCRHIAQAHGGRLEHRSDDGQFHVELRLPIV